MALSSDRLERRRRAARRSRNLYQRSREPRQQHSSWFVRLLLGLLLLGFVAVGGVAAAAYAYYNHATADVGSPGQVIATLADYGGAQIYDRNGTLLYRFPDPQGGIQSPIPLGEISPALVNATVSTEDSTFWTNPGFDVQGVAGAVLHNTQSSGDPFSGAGGSAITQQLVKNTLIPPDQRTAHSLDRKATELAYAVELTRTYPKSQILDWYLNTVNYGGVYDGIESAAEGYFGIHAKDLDLAQASMLAGIPQSPAQYSPYADKEGAKQRQAEVLDLMVKHGYITQDEADSAKQEPLQYQTTQQSLPIHAPWFVEYVKQQLIARFGQHCFDTCGLVVQTTLDLNLENQAQSILNDNLTKYGDATGVHDGALLSIDARTGEILVMLGSRNYNDDSPPIQGSNNFTTAVLQPGSSFKPFVYMTLFLKRGYGPDSVIWDVPFTSDTGYQCEDPVPGNKTQGPIPVRLALGSSLNCAANRAADTAGISNIIDTAHKMGITTMADDGTYGASIATGGANLTMLDLAYAYTTLARNGNMIGDTAQAPNPKPADYRPLDPVAITQVKDGRGQIRYQYEPKTQQVVPAPYPYLVTSIISNCQNRRLIWGCGFPEFLLSDGRPVAAKTGTQQGAKVGETLANWQFMYTPQLVTGGWVGNANRTTWTDVNGSANAVGYSVQQLEDLITKQYNIPPAQFQKPDGVVSVPVHVADGSLGLLGGCGPIEQGLFADGTQPDINNRVCKNGRLVVPPEQANTGGLQADGRVCNLNTPTPEPRTGRIPPSGQNCVAGVGSGFLTGTPPATTPQFQQQRTSSGQPAQATDNGQSSAVGQPAPVQPPVQQAPVFVPVTPRQIATPQQQPAIVAPAAPQQAAPAEPQIPVAAATPEVAPAAPQPVAPQPRVVAPRPVSTAAP
jgi:membrane peptidoglycan carboxypeptidase